MIMQILNNNRKARLQKNIRIERMKICLHPIVNKNKNLYNLERVRLHCNKTRESTNKFKTMRTTNFSQRKVIPKQILSTKIKSLLMRTPKVILTKILLSILRFVLLTKRKKGQ